MLYQTRKRLINQCTQVKIIINNLQRQDRPYLWPEGAYELICKLLIDIEMYRSFRHLKNSCADANSVLPRRQIKMMIRRCHSSGIRESTSDRNG